MSIFVKIIKQKKDYFIVFLTNSLISKWFKMKKVWEYLKCQWNDDNDIIDPILKLTKNRLSWYRAFNWRNQLCLKLKEDKLRIKQYYKEKGS